MATYLPVLLVSVTNASIIPDDSSVSTLPRGQVDYLSHNWLEEDVWLSWRKMTRQKNEITNGVRLENASWRTWWKQRNKLKTITPETLNWLKDSDVTWLYGPLHTATDWAPPVKPKTDNHEIMLDGTTQLRHKPILKYRSISELLTSELPPPSVFSPSDPESEETQPQVEIQAVSDIEVPASLATSTAPARPPLLHTKSDTHLTRWSANRSFRKGSPPRIEFPNASTDGHAMSQNESSNDGYASQVRSSHSQDSSSTGASTTGLADRRSNQKKRHISFNTFVEQCIAIEKPNSMEDTSKHWGPKRLDSDDGYEEDEEDNGDDDDEVWDGRTRRPPLSGSAIAGSDSDEDEQSEERIDDDAIEIRPRSYSLIKSTPKKRAPRSPSASASVSTSSSSRSTSTSSASRSISTSSSSPQEHSIPPSTRVPSRRSSTTSTYRPRPRLYPSTHYSSFRSGSECESQGTRTKRSSQVHVTIAPIAPTILKTTETGYDGWAEGFGDEGGSDDGLWGGRWGSYNEQTEGLKDRDSRTTDDDETTPVELVYVPPPFIGRFSLNVDAGTEEEDFDICKEERIEEKAGVDDTRYSYPKSLRNAEGSSSLASPRERSDSSATSTSTITPSTPNVDPLSQPVHAMPQISEALQTAFGEPASHEKRFRLSSPVEGGSSSSSSSRSRSRSRTPSPFIDSAETVQNIATDASLKRPSSSSPTISSSSSLLAPPVQRGRSSSYQDLASRNQQARGRSSTRTPSSHSDREGNGGVESPIGSLSPDSSFIRVASAVGGAYASGRLDKERQKEKERREEREQGRERGREKERGRDRTGKRPSQSLSPDFESGIVMQERSCYEGRAARVASDARSQETAVIEAAAKGSVIGTRSSEETKFMQIPIDEQDITIAAADEHTQRRIQPTPSNSPTITMKASPAGLVALKVDTTFQTSHTQAQPYSSHELTSSSPIHRHTPNTHSSHSPRVRSPIKGKPPLLMPSPPHPAAPSTSLRISPPGPQDPSAVASSQQQQSPGSPTTMVEKAVGMVSSAGAFFGLWNRDKELWYVKNLDVVWCFNLSITQICLPCLEYCSFHAIECQLMQQSAFAVLILSHSSFLVDCITDTVTWVCFFLLSNFRSFLRTVLLLDPLIHQVRMLNPSRLYS